MLNRFALPCFMAAAMVGCDTAENPSSAAPQDKPGQARDFVSGALVYEHPITETARFAVYKERDGYLTTLDLHMDRDKDIRPSLEAALEKPTLEETYLALNAVKPRSGAMPKILADLDREALRSAAPVTEGAFPTQSDAESGSVSAFAGAGPLRALAKSAVSEPDWDWGADVAWFKGLLRDDSPFEHEFWATMTEWHWVQRKGFRHTGSGMAASHIAKARFRTWRESCDLFSCDWDAGIDKTLEPRTLSIARYNNNASQGPVMRKFQVDGKDPSKLVHLGLMWNTTKNFTPNPAGSDLTVSVASFTGNNLKWVVKNSGTNSVTNPVVRITLTPNVEPTVLTERISTTLAPGQTFTRNTFVPDPMFHAELMADPDNLVRESNEMNNFASANESP